MRGERVRSLSEVYIANFLLTHRIDYRYEKPVFLQVGRKIPVPDFYLPKYDLYVEFWGHLDEKKTNALYWERFRRKVQFYKKNNIRILPLLPVDLKDLENVFFLKLREVAPPPLVSKNFCERCGTKVQKDQEEGVIYCKVCGSKI